MGTEATLWSVIRVLAGLLKPNFPLVILWSVFPTTGVPKGRHSIAGQKSEIIQNQIDKLSPSDSCCPLQLWREELRGTGKAGGAACTVGLCADTALNSSSGFAHCTHFVPKPLCGQRPRRKPGTMVLSWSLTSWPYPACLIASSPHPTCLDKLPGAPPSPDPETESWLLGPSCKVALTSPQASCAWLSVSMSTGRLCETLPQNEMAF